MIGLIDDLSCFLLRTLRPMHVRMQSTILGDNLRTNLERLFYKVQVYQRTAGMEDMHMLSTGTD